MFGSLRLACPASRTTLKAEGSSLSLAARIRSAVYVLEQCEETCTPPAIESFVCYVCDCRGVRHLFILASDSLCRLSGPQTNQFHSQFCPWQVLTTVQLEPAALTVVHAADVWLRVALQINLRLRGRMLSVSVHIVIICFIAQKVQDTSIKSVSILTVICKLRQVNVR